MSLPRLVLICSKLTKISVRLFSGYAHSPRHSYVEEQPVLDLLSLLLGQPLNCSFELEVSQESAARFLANFYIFETPP